MHSNECCKSPYKNSLKPSALGLGFIRNLHPSPGKLWKIVSYEWKNCDEGGAFKIITRMRNCG